MSSIDDLETIFVEAVMTKLVVDVEIHKNHLRVYMKHSDHLEDTIKKLTRHIKKNFRRVKHFNINLQNATLDIYHYSELEKQKRFKAMEEKL